MSIRNFKLSALFPLALVALVGLSLGIISCNQNKTDAEDSKVKASGPTKVLYVTHEPGKYHDYITQRAMFQKVADQQKWSVTVLSGSHDEMIEKLATTPDFGAGYDVIVYNFCFAHCDNLNVPHNIIQQTQEKGIPAMLIHCSLHSFWPSFKEKGEHAIHSPGAHPKAHTRKDLLEKWTKENPDKAFPAWPNFTGIASTHHSKKQAINVKKADADHAIVKDVPEYKTAKNAEIYYNFINANDSKSSHPILEATEGQGTHAILWEHPVGKSKVVSFTLGHSLEEWRQKEYLNLIANTVNYLTAE